MEHLITQFSQTSSIHPSSVQIFSSAPCSNKLTNLETAYIIIQHIKFQISLLRFLKLTFGQFISCVSTRQKNALYKNEQPSHFDSKILHNIELQQNMRNYLWDTLKALYGLMQSRLSNPAI
jgi:hypothetical protein